MNYPEFEGDCQSLLKKCLNKEIWSWMKKRATHLGGKIQLCIQCGVHNQKDPIGVYATDEEAYKVFEDLFNPIIHQLHPEFDSKYSFKNDFELSAIKPMPEIVQWDPVRLTLIWVMAWRNFKEYPFVPMMSTEMKL